ncbi:hypothetical protein [Burkholderia sp. BCC1999]|nr:hypothetical protein [Burkholderia sp. BCC1999]
METFLEERRAEHPEQHGDAADGEKRSVSRRVGFEYGTNDFT